jgi:hypothetical protein
MRVFFETPMNGWGQDPNNRQQWEMFLANIAIHAPPGSVVGSPADADVIIHSCNEQIGNSPIVNLVKPLMRRDVERYIWDWGDRPTGRFSGFYCSLPSVLYDRNRHRTICYPIAFNEMVEEFSQNDAKYDFGFVGGITAGTRERLVRFLKSREGQDNSMYKIQGVDWSRVSERTGDRVKEEYVEFLRATKFILCPRGYGVGTARLFEAMKAGRVPVIISDDYVVPIGIDWRSCSIVIREDKLTTIPAVIAARLDEWPQMARAARACWESCFSERSIARYMLEQLIQIQQSTLHTDLAYRLTYPARIGSVILSTRVRPILGRLKQRLMR